MFLPDNIDLAQSEKYRLSIRLTPNGFSFLIFLETDSTVHYFHESIYSINLSPIENIKKVFFESNLFIHPFKKISVYVVSTRYTFVPHELFNKSCVDKYFKFNFNGDAGNILYNSIKEHDLNVLFDIDEEVYAFLYRNLWNPIFLNFTTHLIPFFTTYGYTDKKRAFVVFHDKMITISCFDSEVLLSTNTMTYSSQNDIMYYVVNIWDKQSFDQNNDYLYLSGDTDNNMESILTLRQIIKNVNDVVIPKNMYTDSTTSNIPTDILFQL